VRLLLLAGLNVDGSRNVDGLDGRAALRAACDLARDLRVDALCCAGDLFDHASATAGTGEFLRECFASISPVRVFIAPGRRDWYSSDGPYPVVDQAPNVHIFDEPELMSVDLDGGQLWGAGRVGPDGAP
jgi:DNA repair exonuclease SbcCD nuclease subunit